MEYRCYECRDLLGKANNGKLFCVNCNRYYKTSECEKIYESRNGRIPKGCQACGGPYPFCKSSCNLFDN